MKPAGWIFLGVVAAMPPQMAFAQHAGGGAPLTETQKTGQMLYEQSCGVCHTKPTLVSAVFGPILSQETLEGQQELIQSFIANGSARMPGFKVMYKPDQIAAIASYLKTVPKPAAEAAPDQRNAPRVQD